MESNIAEPHGKAFSAMARYKWITGSWHGYFDYWPQNIQLEPKEIVTVTLAKAFNA